ncbi:hypothetical protein PAXRUDRAFT_166946 [Paxillus rubicundulus Ve08.2h10]|uniref:Uncharacterized protein n=1 Tax=Paxillus rubicundulus Ve08.2h10 TaxID=930991 RepID=A0A0D0CPY6_9AGAM|nr:hypothetical protein PAXRUDRAFT_166946 [Paxillus rubicundulus Ve08.2h10]
MKKLPFELLEEHMRCSYLVDPEHMDGLAALGLASVVNALDKFKGGWYKKGDNTINFAAFYHCALHIIQTHIHADTNLTSIYISLCCSICKKGQSLWGSEKLVDEDDNSMVWV